MKVSYWLQLSLSLCLGRSILYHSWTLYGVMVRRREVTIFVFSGSGNISLMSSSESVYINGLLPTFKNCFTCSWLLTWFSYRLWGPLYLLIPPRMFFMGGRHNSCFHYPFPLFLVWASVWPELSARKDGHLERRWDFSTALG